MNVEKNVSLAESGDCAQKKLAYHRVLLKLSGEALMGKGAYGIDPEFIQYLAAEIADLSERGLRIALVIGGGNICRGVGLAKAIGLDRSSADQMGMLATVINSIAMQGALEKKGCVVRVMSAVSLHEVCEDYIHRRALRHLEKRRIVILAAGTGNAFFTTDTAASLRAAELNVDLVIKATKVDGIYREDPTEHPGAERYDHLNYDEVITRKLEIMDTTSIVLCRENNMPLRVMDIGKPGALLRVVCGEAEGTLVSSAG
ncbi:MAG: UMP kinase [Candidatus Eutrophobiaceae bacterium]